MSKGSKQRPIEDREAWAKNFERIFGVTVQEFEDILDETEEPDTVGQDPAVEGEDLN